MDTIKASSKGQIVIPKAIRRALNIRPGTELAVQQLSETSFTVSVSTESPAEQARALRGLLKRPGRRKPLTDAEMERQILTAVREDDERIKRAWRRRRR